MQDVGYAALQIIPSFKDLDRNLEAGTSKAMLAAGTRGGTKFGESAGRSAGQTFGRVFMSAAKVGLVGLTALGVGAFKLGKDAIGQASDLNESLNAVNLTYKDQAKAVQKLGREAATSLGLSNTEFNSLSVRFSAFAKTIGGGGKGVVTTLDDLTTRAADFASVMNLEVNEAAELFQSGLAGETEPLRKYGLDLSAARVEAFALSEGIVKNKDDLNEAAKVQARYALLMKDTAQTQGDFSNTSDQLANSQRILSARWDDAQAKLGKALLPLMTDLVGFILDKGLPAFEKFSEWFTDDGLPAIQDFASDMRPLAESVLPAVGDALKIMADTAKDAAPYVKGLVDSFNDMPKWAKTALIGGGATLLAGRKLGLVGGGSGGGPGGLLAGGVQKVFVTNPGFSAGGGVAAGSKGGTVVAGGGGPKGGMTLAKGFITIAAAYFAADAITKILGWKEQGPKGAAKEEAFREKWGVDPLEAGNNANYALFDKTGVDPGAGLFGLQRNDEGLAADLMSRDTQTLIRLGAELREEYGRGYEALERMGRLPDGFTDWFKTQKQEAREYAATLETFPEDLQTHVKLFGAPESRKEAMELVRQYDLTPKEKRTLFQLFGIPDSKRAMNEFKDVLGGVPKNPSSKYTLYGVNDALAALGRAQTQLNNLDGKTYKAIIELHTVRTGAGGQNLGYDGAADGATVPGPRAPYGDKIPYLLAPGEEVISNRHGQADRYRSLLKAINANRGLASGGTVGGININQPSLAGLRIEGSIELTGTGGYLRGVIAEEITADRGFTKGHVRGYEHG